MELNGAFSNPRLQLELPRLGAIHEQLLLQAVLQPRQPRPTPVAVPQVLATVTHVLEQADRPLPASEIHRAAEELAGRPLLRTSVKAALAVGASGPAQRFRRVQHGVYQLARDVSGSTT